MLISIDAAYLASSVEAIGNNLISFKYNGKVRMGRIARIVGGAVTLKNEGDSKERPFSSFTFTKIESRITVQH